MTASSQEVSASVGVAAPGQPGSSRPWKAVPRCARLPLCLHVKAGLVLHSRKDVLVTRWTSRTFLPPALTSTTKRISFPTEARMHARSPGGHAA